MSDEKTPGKIVSAGAPVAGKPGFAPPAEGAATSDVAPKPTDTNTANDKPTDGTPTPPTEEIPDIPIDDLKKFFKKQGIEGFETIDDLKTKIQKADAPPPPEETPEQKAEKEKAFDKRMLDHYIEHGGTAESFVALKQLASSENLKDLSISEIKKEMKKENFTDAEIEMVLTERYYQLNPDELKKGEDEDEADFEKKKALIKKKVAYGSKLLENRSLPIKQQAAGILKGLRESVQTQDLLAQKEAEFSSKVDEFAKKLPRKITLELGEINSKKIDPVPYEVSDVDIAEVVETLKDPAKRQQYFFNQDNSLNLTNVAQMMLRNKYLESALKAVYMTGSDRQVAELEKTFPYRNPNDVGVGGGQKSGQGTKGKIVKAGQPERVVR